MSRKMALFWAWIAVIIGGLTTGTAFIMLVIDIINQIIK